MSSVMSVTGGVCPGDPLRAAIIFHSPLKSVGTACDSRPNTRSARTGIGHPLRAAYQLLRELNLGCAARLPAQPSPGLLEQRVDVPEEHQSERVEHHEPGYQT